MLGVAACGGAATATNPTALAVPANGDPDATRVPTVGSGATDLPAPTPDAPAPSIGSDEEESSKPIATSEATGSLTPPAVPLGVPMVDKTNHSVPLEDVVFDTFGGSPRFLPLDRISDEGILQLRDAIVPIAEPAYGSPGDLPWLEDEDLVMGYQSGSGAFAYPVNILDFHEIVNDVIDGAPVLVTYCPLCFSGVVFNRELDGRVLTFGNTSALYQSDLVMYDHQTGSFWFQVGGEAVVGTLTGARLDLLPSTTMAWGEWKRLYPETLLLTGTPGAPDAFANRRYARGFSAGYQDQINDNKFAFPVDQDRLDDRLSSGEIVLTVEVGESATAFPLGIIGSAAVNHEVGGRPVVVFISDFNRLAVAFSRAVEGRTLTFDYSVVDQRFIDRETSSVWDGGGRAIDGPLAGSRLEQMNTRRAFWFSVAIALPNVEVYQP